MANVYWCDPGNSTIYWWNGTTLTSTVIDPWEELGSLIIGPNNKLVVGKWDEAGVHSFALDLPGFNNRVNWPEQQRNGVAIRRVSIYNTGVYDPGTDKYWVLIDPTLFDELGTGQLPNPVLGKYNTDGTLVSLHCDNPEDFDLVSNRQTGGQIWLHDGWLYWNGDKIITRYEIATDTWQWCWARPHGSAYIAGQRRAVLGITPDNKLVCHWYDSGTFDDYIELYQLSALTWTTFPNPATLATETGGAGLPAWSLRWRIDDNPNGHIAASAAYSGWAAYDGANAVYFGALDGSTEVLDSIDLSTGTVTTHTAYVASDSPTGMVVTADLIGQLYVNLSTTQSTPQWVSVCPTGAPAGWNYYDSVITSPAKASTDIVYRNSTPYSWTTNVTGTTNYLFRLQHNAGAAQTVNMSNSVGSGAAGTFTLFGFIQPNILVGVRNTVTTGDGTPHLTTFSSNTLAVISTLAIPVVSGYTFQRYYVMHDGVHVPDGSGVVTIWYSNGSAFKAYRTTVTATGTIPAFTEVFPTSTTLGPNDKGQMYTGTIWCGQALITSGPNAGQSRARAFDATTNNWTAPQNLPSGTTDQYTAYFQNDYISTTEYVDADEWTPMYAGSGSHIGTGPTTRLICKMVWDADFEWMTTTGDTWAVPDPSTWSRVFAIRLTNGKAVAMLVKTGPVVDGNTTTIVQIWYDLFGTPEIVGTYQDYNGFAASSRPYIRVSTKGSFMMLWNSDGTHRQWQLGEGNYAGHFNTNASGTTWTQVHLGDFYANTATSGSPTWYTCCSHG